MMSQAIRKRFFAALKAMLIEYMMLRESSSATKGGFSLTLK
jgi:hypothetical protein